MVNIDGTLNVGILFRNNCIVGMVEIYGIEHTDEDCHH